MTSRGWRGGSDGRRGPITSANKRAFILGRDRRCLLFWGYGYLRFLFSKGATFTRDIRKSSTWNRSYVHGSFQLSQS